MVYYVCCGEMSERSKVKVSKPKPICGKLNSEIVDMTRFYESI